MLKRIQLPNAPIPAPGNVVFEGHLNPVTPDQYIKSQELAQANSGEMQLAFFAPPAGPVYSIKELANGLENDPDKIFLHVRNNIQFQPVWGSQKGAFSCMVEGKGGAIDQAALMIALLTEAGYDSKIVIGQIRITASQAADWLGTDPNNYQSAGRLLTNGFIANTYVSGSGSSALIDVMHAWVKVNIGGTWYAFDPAYKAYSTTAGIDLVAAIGYNATNFDAACLSGATQTADYMKNVNFGGMTTQLETMSANLRTWIATNNPDATLTDLIGGRSIIVVSGTFRNTSLSYQKPGSTPVEYAYASLPNSYKSKLRFRYIDIGGGAYDFDLEFYSQDIAGKRLTLTFDGSNYAELRLEGSLLKKSTNPVPGAYYYARFTVTNNTYTADWFQITHIGSHHLIANGWGAGSPEMAFYHQKLLADARAAGVAETDEQVIGESLSVLWHNWNAEKSAAADLVGRINGCVVSLLHQIGVVGFYRNNPSLNQDGAPFTDLGGILWSTSASDLSTTREKVTNAALSLRGVGFESTAVSQVSGIAGVSTDTLMLKANADGQKIYQASLANWLTNVKPNLINYSPAELQAMQDLVNGGATIMVHENGDTTQTDYLGYGFYARYSSGNTQGLITGGLNGTTSSLPTTVPNYNQNSQTNQPQATSQLKDERNKVEVDYIVDTQTGDFKYHETDFTVGDQPAPWGMGFTRFHNSKDRNEYSTMGYGWRHNHMITAVEGSNGYAGFGTQSGTAGSDSLAQLTLLVQLLTRDPNGQLTFLFSTLTLANSGNTLTNNVVNVRDGEKSYVFTLLQQKDANGKYTIYASPPGVGLGLVKVPGALPSDTYFRMESLDGVVWTFRPDGQISTIQYPHGVTWTYTYQAFPALLLSVSNGIGVTLNFTYQAVGPSFLNILKEVSANGGTVKASYTVLEKKCAFGAVTRKAPNAMLPSLRLDTRSR
ncbi:MAG: hypothetical protein K2X93_04080, partial [Candidatus Obscuribacterales bacterium]|nr:hypothetical protein [Candidatus Obscuribacterales bacterium]